jgi:hypothetical protein
MGEIYSDRGHAIKEQEKAWRDELRETAAALDMLKTDHNSNDEI